MNRQKLADRLREHADLHEELSEHRDEEQLQWEHDLRAAAGIIQECVCGAVHEVKLPDRCKCDPDGWDDSKYVKPICSTYVRSRYGWCRKCTHGKECHKKRAQDE